MRQSLKILAFAEWQPQAEAHRRRVAPWIQPRLQRRKQGAKHPVDDFLFEYYAYRPRQLSMWHPGWRHGLANPTSEYREHADYVEVMAHTNGSRSGPTESAAATDMAEATQPVARTNPDRLARRRPRLERAVAILSATAERQPRLGCFGMHEWAMVYGARQDELRHEQVPLRLSPERVRDTVDDIGLRCTHFDAYRFFTSEASTKQSELTRQTQVDHEQPACLHAGMDLYRYAHEAGPFLPSDLVADCFEHARSARTLDMQASPYDVSTFGLEPVAVETPTGRAEYAARQQELATKAKPLRDRLLIQLQDALLWGGVRL